MRIMRSIFYLSAALGMLIYALPRLDMGEGLTLPTIFGVCWIAMALLIIASHLRVVLRVDEAAYPVHVTRHS